MLSRSRVRTDRRRVVGAPGRSERLVMDRDRVRDRGRDRVSVRVTVSVRVRPQ